MPGADYKIVLYDAQRQPQLREVKRWPRIRSSTSRAFSRTAPAPTSRCCNSSNRSGQDSGADRGAARADRGRQPAFTVAGIGVTKRGDGKSGGTIRAATLTATGQPGRLQIRLVDPATNNTTEGLGACTGDSGAPVFEDQNGRAVIVGVVSWSTGAQTPPAAAASPG